MIVSFSVSNFGVIKEPVKLNFEATDSEYLDSFYIMEPISGLRLLKAMFLYGANASGKSTLLRALNFLRRLVLRPLGNKEDELQFSSFAFDPTFQRGLSTMELDFVMGGHRYKLSIAFDQCHIDQETLLHCEVSGSWKTIYERSTTADKELARVDYLAEDLSEDDCAGLRANTLWNNLVLGGYMKVNASSEHLNRVCQWFRVHLKPGLSPEVDPLDRGDRKLKRLLAQEKADADFLSSLMRQADFGVSSIHVEEAIEPDWEEMTNLLKEEIAGAAKSLSRLSNLLRKHETQVNLTHKNRDGVLAVLPLEQESLGTRRYLQLMLDLMHVIKHKQILSIDELESSLHPDLYDYILKVYLASSRESQLLIATHNRELLRQEDLLRWDAVWFMQRQPDGGVSLFSAADYEEDALTKGVSLYNAYRAGRLGAVPLLQDCYIDFFGDGTGAHK